MIQATEGGFQLSHLQGNIRALRIRRGFKCIL